MGHRKKLNVITIDLNEKYEGLVIRMKSPSLGKLRKLMTTLEGERLAAPMIGAIIDLLGSHLLTWTLEDEEGVELPATTDEVGELDLPMLMDIAYGWIDSVTNVDDDLGKDSPSGEQFPGRPVTMEAL